MKFKCLLFSFLLGCGSETAPTHENKRTQDNSYEQLQQQILALQGTVDQINAFTNNEYDTCSNTGDGVNQFVQQVCKIAQSATADELVEIKGELGTYANNLQTEINSIQANEATDASNITTINAQITTINSSLAALQIQMNSANSAITALQSTVNGITTTLNNTLVSVEIGTENVSAGPLYESLERRTDKTKIVAFIVVVSGNHVVNEGLGLLWQTSTGADTSVRTTSYGTPYNFIVLANGNVCYSKTDSNASFSHIVAQSSDIVCK